MVSPKIKYLVLDVLKPHDPLLPEFTVLLCELANVSKVDISLIEMDDRTESLRVIIEGKGIKFDELKKHIEEQGATIHSVDQVVVEKPAKHEP